MLLKASSLPSLLDAIEDMPRFDIALVDKLMCADESYHRTLQPLRPNPDADIAVTLLAIKSQNENAPEIDIALTDQEVAFCRQAVQNYLGSEDNLGFAEAALMKNFGLPRRF